MASISAMNDLVGRQEQLKSLERILDLERPSLVLVTGQVGSGKSRLVQEVRAGAERRGWRTAPRAREPGFMVTRDATPQSVSKAIREALQKQSEDLAIDTAPNVGAFALSREVAGPSAARAAPPASATHKQTTSLLDQLREAGRALVVIDGFRPNSAFARWFSSELLPSVKESGLPSIIVVVSETEPDLNLLQHVDERIELGQLDVAETERYFRELGAQLSPPMDDVELQTYAQAAAERPELIYKLRRVLALVEGTRK